MSIKNGKEVNCGNCGKNFYLSKSRLKRVNFCSYECDTQDRRVRLAGHKNPFYRKNHSKETKEKMSRENHHNWKGGRFLDKEGYVFILKPDHPRANQKGYIREHILIMEKIIGRCLWPEEVIHHINGIKSDNRASNLMKFDNNASHTRYHNLIKKESYGGRE